ncbi:hypothetical protein [Agromyces seonyuensis]|uniref:Uncharacterized protein n=1 Tax=Agromyces seonyuensis TaxID=2662446 RepID=A0A6I4P0D8_9MICO|nr:hypothetical protein [Agromyces seonyuensis]MWC00007.1 hypothetical protein [Agromyces seonyuensis]
MSVDPVSSAAIADALRSAGARCEVVGPSGLAEALAQRWEHVLVEVDRSPGPDRFRAVAGLGARLARAGRAGAIAITAGAVGAAVRLRLAEAGFAGVVEADRLAARPGVLDAAEIALEDAGHLRSRLGLAAEGALEPFLQVCRSMPAAVWNDPTGASAAAPGRASVLCRLAENIAGFPGTRAAFPHFGPRAAPPSWDRVRAFVRAGFGLDD